VRQLIKRILREEREKDLSPKIEKLLNDSVVPNHKLICKVEVKAPWKLVGNNSTSDYQVVVTVIGGAGSKNWPMTQFVHGSRDKVVNDVWHTVYNFMGINTDVFLKTVKSCDEVLTESTNERLEKLVGDYITMSYPTAQKLKVSPPNVNAEITTFTLPDAQDEKDNLIFKFEVFGKPEYHINPEFYDSINSVFGGNKNIKKLILKWFNNKEVDIDLLENPDSQKQEQNESELTERCWKGYTQKGMKTMFGKRYPNCVKKKKKSVNETSIRDILKKFAGFTATDDKQEFQKIVDIITKITKKNNPVDGMIGVAVVDVVKEMWGQTYTDPKSLGSRWDFSVVLRPLFPENYIGKLGDGSQLENFKEEFLSNTRGMGFEIVSPVTHEKVKNYKVNYIFSGILWVN
jgi:hypothetical protein